MVSSHIGWNFHTEPSVRRPPRQSLRGNLRLHGWSPKGLYTVQLDTVSTNDLEQHIAILSPTEELDNIGESKLSSHVVCMSAKPVISKYQELKTIPTVFLVRYTKEHTIHDTNAGPIRRSSSNWLLCPPAELSIVGVREFATAPANVSPSDLTSPSMTNKGIRRGPGGRSSVSSRSP
jgi:hypothetical protein